MIKINKNLFRVICLTFSAMFLLTPLYAGTDPAAFLNLGVGARALGMGGAFTAVADDYTAAYWNPAGLGLLDRINVGTMVQSLASARWEGMEDITPKYQFVSFVLPLNKLTFFGHLLGGSAGFSWIHSQLNNIPLTQVDATGNLIRAGSFADREDGYLFSYGREIFMKELYLGGNLKIIQQNFSGISGANATGWGIDGGLLYVLNEDWKIGLIVEKGVEMSWANGHKDVGGLREKLGLNYRYLDRERIKGIAAVDLEQAEKEPLIGRLGTELKFYPEFLGGGIKSDFKLNNIAVRLGVDEYALENRYGVQSKLNNNFNLTFGLGISLNIFGQGVGLDYSFGSYRLGDQHRISLGLSF